MFRLLSLLALSAALFMLATPASAQKAAAKGNNPSAAAPAESAPPASTPALTPRKKASKLFRQGIRSSREGVRQSKEGRKLLEAALVSYNKAKELFSSYKIDLNIGGVMAYMGRRAESAVYHEKFLQRMAKDVPKEIVSEAKQQLAQLREELGSVTLDTPMAGIKIQINGEDVAETPQSMPWYGEPGKYVVILSKEGYVTDTRRMVLKKNDHRAIKVRLTSVEEAERQQRAREELLRKKDRKKIIGYSTLAAGAALAVGAAVLYGVGASRGNEAFDGYTTTSSIQEQQRYLEQIDSAEGLLLGGHVVIGLAAAALGVAAWQIIAATRMDEEPPTPDQPKGIKAAFVPTQGGAAFSLSGRF